MDTQWPQQDVEDRIERAEVERLISERNREDAEEHRNTMETMRQMAEEIGAPAASAGKFTVSSLEPHMHSSHF